SVSGAGDVNGDGIDDFVVGSACDASGGPGRVSIYFGGSGVDTLEDLSYVGNPSGGAIGLSVAGGGHVDGPGPSDVIAGAFWDPGAIATTTGASTSLRTRSRRSTPAPGRPMERDATTATPPRAGRSAAAVSAAAARRSSLGR